MTCQGHGKSGRSRFPEFYCGDLATTRKKCEGYICSYSADQARPGWGLGGGDTQDPMELLGDPTLGLSLLFDWLCRKSQRPWSLRMQGGDTRSHQESTISVSVSAVVKKAKTIQYIIHFT